MNPLTTASLNNTTRVYRHGAIALDIVYVVSHLALFILACANLSRRYLGQMTIGFSCLAYLAKLSSIYLKERGLTGMIIEKTTSLFLECIITSHLVTLGILNTAGLFSTKKLFVPIFIDSFIWFFSL